MGRKLGSGRLVIATHNAGKLKEIAALLAPYGLDCLSAGSLGLPEPAETGKTFVENALLKARAAAESSGLPALADDSGLVGRSARRAARGLHRRLGRAAMVRRRAGPRLVHGHGQSRGHAAAPRVLRHRARRGVPLRARARLARRRPRGLRRQGRRHADLAAARHDGLRLRSGVRAGVATTQTFAELDPAEKHRISHRADAFARLVADQFARAEPAQ